MIQKIKTLLYADLNIFVFLCLHFLLEKNHQSSCMLLLKKTLLSFEYKKDASYESSAAVEFVYDQYLIQHLRQHSCHLMNLICYNMFMWRCTKTWTLFYLFFYIRRVLRMITDQKHYANPSLQKMKENKPKQKLSPPKKTTTKTKNKKKQNPKS